MAKMSEDEVLELWGQISGYQSDWETVIAELLDELEGITIESTGDEESYEDLENDPEAIKDSLLNIRDMINEQVEGALKGEVVKAELAEFFARMARALQELEQRVFELRELSREYDIYELEEDMWGSEEEEE